MTSTRPFAQLSAPIENDPERMSQVAQYERAMETIVALGEIRSRRQVTQQELAQRLSVTQANISKIEHKEDIYLSTLRNYVAGLGGQLEVRIVFPDETIAIEGDH